MIRGETVSARPASVWQAAAGKIHDYVADTLQSTIANDSTTQFETLVHASYAKFAWLEPWKVVVTDPRYV